MIAFYSLNSIAAFYLFNKNFKTACRINLKTQDLQEKINILSDRNLQEVNNKAAIEEKIRRYINLKNIIEKINKNFDLDYIAANLTDTAFSIIGANKGICVLYLVDDSNQKIFLFKTKKENDGLCVKAKEGDIFDSWVLRHVSSLLVQDTRKDFRFDLDKIKKCETRHILSVISSPFVSENKFLGILRLDYSCADFYSQEDLRFLVAISDIGAVALENGELFRKTQDLAVHDGLTSFYTKGYFLERLKEECKRSVRQGRHISLLMLDIDYFKSYNDKFGHTAGDIVLRKISSNIEISLKKFNTVIGRFGGEEFCVVLLGKNKDEACLIAEGLRRKIEKTKIILRRQETGITVSIGLSCLSRNIPDEEEMIRRADSAMYAAKQKGRNRVVSA